jgi:hypothetical protein
MFATATTPAARHSTSPSSLAPRLRPAITVLGRVCSTPTLRFTATGVAAAHFLLECDELPDPRLRVLSHRGTSIVDVTVWQEDAIFVADLDAAYSRRYRLVMGARKSEEPAVWDLLAPFTPPVRHGARVEVEGTPRAGWWHAIGHREPMPFGVVAERLTSRRSAPGGAHR